MNKKIYTYNLKNVKVKVNKKHTKKDKFVLHVSTTFLFRNIYNVF